MKTLKLLFKALTGGMVLLIWGIVTVMAGSPQPKGTFSIHIQTAGGEGIGNNQAVQITLPDPEDVIYISAIPEITQALVEDIIPLKTPEGDGAVIRLTKRGKMLLNNLTTQSQGKIMVVFLNGRLVFAPKLDTAIDGSYLVIPKGVASVDIEMLKREIKKNKE